MQQTLIELGKIAGLPAPRKEIPYWLATGFAEVNEFVAMFTHQPPRVPLAGVRMAKYKMWFDPSKAIRELGLPQTSPGQAFADAVQWFRIKGYQRSAQSAARMNPCPTPVAPHPCSAQDG
jgi:dihydroflavonol-4-reductase